MGKVVKVKPIAHGDSCGQPAALVVMQSPDAAADAVDKWGFRQGNKTGPLVRFRHPKNAARDRLKAAAQNMLDDDGNADYEDYE